MECDEGGGVWV